MDDKQFITGRNNEASPAPGMASVNTHNPTEESHRDGQRDVQEGEAAFDTEEAERQKHNGPQEGHRQEVE